MASAECHRLFVYVRRLPSPETKVFATRAVSSFRVPAGRENLRAFLIITTRRDLIEKFICCCSKGKFIVGGKCFFVARQVFDACSALNQGGVALKVSFRIRLRLV